MLEITIPDVELWDEKQQEFRIKKGAVLKLEHSLLSLSKWESKWHKSYFSKEDKSVEEIVDYIKCMTLTQNVDPDVYNYLTNDNIVQIKQYLEDPMTATTITRQEGSSGNREIITSELIYYWMIALNIPVEFQKWHINRLLTLIEVCNIKNSPGKQMSKNEILSKNKALNAARKQRLNSKG